MDMSFLSEFLSLVIFGVCLCVGYVIKNLVPEEKVNRFIPLIVAVIGVAIGVWMNMKLTPEILLTGLLSGLASTGAHQLFTQIINKGGLIHED